MLPNASAYVHRGMANFRRNLVADSVRDFDACILLDASKSPQLWQRGLSLFYLNRFADAATQFALDVSLNPIDLALSFHGAAISRGRDEPEGRDGEGAIDDAPCGERQPTSDAASYGDVPR